jgi:hypothetical protein
MILFAFLVILFLLVGGGWRWNSRRSRAIVHWMQPGLAIFGDQVAIRSLNASTVELKIIKPKPPYQELTVLVVLPPRHIPWLWLGSIFERRQEMLVFRGQMRQEQKLDGEIIEPKSWPGKMGLVDIQKHGWEQQTFGKFILLADKDNLILLRPIAQRLLIKSPCSDAIQRIAFRQKDNRLDVQITLPDFKKEKSNILCEGVRSIVRKI